MHWCARFHTAYREAGGGLDLPAFESFFKASDEAMARLPGIRELGFRAAIDAQARLLVARLPDRVDAHALERRLLTDARAIVARNAPVLERLARRYKLGVVSNFTGNLLPCLQELDLARFFTVISDSAVVGWTKPDPRIFAHTLAALHGSPRAAWMVGDNVEADIRAAAALGMQTCWLAPPDRSAPPGLVATARIAHLPDIERVLG